jgi:hypothetical protein
MAWEATMTEEEECEESDEQGETAETQEGEEEAASTDGNRSRAGQPVLQPSWALRGS